jgi:hypothetical protein
MDNVARIGFEESRQQWLVSLIGQDGTVRPGEPFPAFGGEGFSKLEQVLVRTTQLGFRPTTIPYNKPNATRYAFDVVPN